MSFIYVPKDSNEDKDDNIHGDSAIFAINAHLSPVRGMAIAELYRNRWVIANEYKSIKGNSLPKCASKDYRPRFLYVTVGVLLHNVWRLSNHFLRTEVDTDLGENPPILAGEIVELVAFCLFDPGAEASHSICERYFPRAVALSLNRQYSDYIASFALIC